VICSSSNSSLNNKIKKINKKMKKSKIESSKEGGVLQKVFWLSGLIIFLLSCHIFEASASGDPEKEGKECVAFIDDTTSANMFIYFDFDVKGFLLQIYAVDGKRLYTKNIVGSKVKIPKMDTYTVYRVSYISGSKTIDVVHQ
jgi:hypothetical protein